MSVLAQAVLGVAAVATTGVAWGVAEARSFTVRRLTVPVLAPRATPFTALHVSDVHMWAGRKDEAAWLRGLASLEPDLVVNTGDNLSAVNAVPMLLDALEPLMAIPGVFVNGSNDYFAPFPKNPLTYVVGPTRIGRHPKKLPTAQMTDAFTAAGWRDLNNARTELTVRGTRIAFAGLDDPHIKRDRMPDPTGVTRADLRVGVVHAPYRRALDALREDGAELILAGHTHGGQLRVPGIGALVTNCDLDRARARGLHGWPGERPGAEGGEDSAWLHVSAGAGTSAFAPIRFACRPEATLLELVPRA